MSVERGQMLSHYRLLEKIGEGGMGVVWKAEDTVLNRTVAIKVLPADLALDEERRKMFLDEARLAASVSHAHIVQVHELGREGDLDFIVMEYIEGQPLSKLLHGRPLPPDKVADWGLQVAEGLARAHRKGLIHRDLKPANILVTPDGEVKIVDFGLATLFSRWETTATSTRTLTEAGSVETRKEIAGTLPYMSPEQVRGEKLDARSDIFSFGTVLYEMTTGQRPFTGARPADIVQEILRSQPTPVQKLVPKVPLDLGRIIEKALARRATDRYQTMEDLAVDLRRLGRDLESGSSPSYEDLKGKRSAAQQKKHRAILLAALPLLVVLAALAWLKVARKGQTESDARTVLILPLEVRGETDPYVGRALAEAIAINLAQAKNLTVLPVPAKNTNTEPLEETRHARKLGAGYLLRGSALQDSENVHVSVSLVDVSKNRIRWGVQKDVPNDGLSSLAASLARDVVSKIGGRLPTMYGRPLSESLRRGPVLDGSLLLADAVGALLRHETDAALSATQRLLELFPDELEAHVLRTEALQLAWLREPASPDARRACEQSIAAMERVDPQSPYPDFYRAWFLKNSPRAPEAIEGFNQLLTRGDLTSLATQWVLMHRSEAESFLGEFDKAQADLEEAIRLDPLNAGNHKFLSMTLRRAGRLEEAVARAEQAIALDPADVQSFTAKASALLESGRYEEAAKAFEPECRARPRQPLLARWAISLYRAGQASEASIAAQKAASLPETASGQYNLACFSAVRGDREKAMTYLQRAVALGFANEIVTKDPDLESLRGRPEFEAIVAEVNRRIQARSEPRR